MYMFFKYCQSAHHIYEYFNKVFKGSVNYVSLLLKSAKIRRKYKSFQTLFTRAN